MTNERQERSEGEGRAPGGSSGGRRRLLVFLLLTLVLYFLSRDSSLAEYFTRPAVEKGLATLGVWAPVGFIILYAIGVILTVPASLLTALGGIIFGPLYGTALVVLGATIGASGAFYIGRYMARESVERRLGASPWFRKMDDGIREQGVYFVLFLRLVPLLPFNAINYAAGLTAIRFRDYCVGTFFGIIPATYVFAFAARRMSDVAAGEKWDPEEFYRSLLLLVLLALLPLLYKKFKKE